MADDRLSNVIGAPFVEHVLTQLDLRVAHSSTTDRSAEEILYLANKQAWVKLTSSVRITEQGDQLKRYYEKLNLDTSLYPTGEDLAKKWILQDGTSKAMGAGIGMRSGIGPDNAYGLGGPDDFGYRPMPGLTSVQIDTKGILGSLREATINFKVNSVNQLNIMEVLYFRLGFSMLLEWGHGTFFTNVNSDGRGRGTFTNNSYGLDTFSEPLRKEEIQHQLGKKAKNLSGNYDGMLGIVTNFTWSLTEDGGYDCVVKLIGLGAIIDSLRINLSYTMPDGLALIYKTQRQTINAKYEQEQERIAQEKATRVSAQTEAQLGPTPKDATGVFQLFVRDTGNPEKTSQDIFLEKHSYYSKYQLNSSVTNNIPDYFYTATGPNSIGYNQSKTGLFLNKKPGKAEWEVIPANVSPTSPQPVSIYTGDLVKIADNQSDLLNLDMFSEALVTGFEDPYYIASGITPLPTAKTAPVRFFNGVLNGNKDTFTTKLSNGVVVPTKSFTTAFVYAGDAIAIDGKEHNRVFFYSIGYDPSTGDALDLPSQEDLIKALDEWFSNPKAVFNVTSIVHTTPDIPGDFSIRVAGYYHVVGYHKFNELTIIGTLEGLKFPKGKTAPRITLRTDDASLISKVLPRPTPPTPTPPAITAATINNGDGSSNTATAEQTISGENFESSLQAMLSAVQNEIWTQIPSDPAVGMGKVDLNSLMNAFYEGGVLKGIFTLKKEDPQSFNLQQYALRGFNSNLMADPSMITKIEPINFTNLCTGYGIKYKTTDRQSNIKYPTYIKLGSLLAFLNNMCLIYESTQDTEKHPYVYIDFNPETNFCLTNPQHLSVDPLTCLIPFQGKNEDYNKIFPESIKQWIEADTSLFKPEQGNEISGNLNSFKSSTNIYQGKIMEILLNVDFLLGIVKQHTSKDESNSIYLKGFLDDVMIGISKVTGNLNLFRVSYRDDSNTVIIKDDQYVPPAAGEPNILNRKEYLESNGRVKYGQLPVFGKQSIVRAMEFKTNITTNVSKQIAISAQAGVDSVNATDNSPFSYLNTGLVDAFKSQVSNSNNPEGNADSTANTIKNTNVIISNLQQAQKFNAHIVSIYHGALEFNQVNTSMATNYYGNSISKIKADDLVTTAAPFIPANLSLTMDGISGIVMGNAFTIPEDRLPMSLRGPDGFSKVGFVVVGLTHMIEANQWTTRIRGQMINLRQDVRAVQPIKQQPVLLKSNPAPTSTKLGQCKNIGCTRKTREAYKSTALYKDPTFRKGIEALNVKYNIKDSEALYKVMYAECRMNPYDQTISRTSGKVFAVGLLQWTPDNVGSVIPSLDEVTRTSGVGQLKYVDRYLNQYRNVINGGGFLELYSIVFFPLAARHLNNPDWIIQSKDLSAWSVSYHNPVISCAAGKQPGEALTIKDFKTYVDCNNI